MVLEIFLLYMALGIFEGFFRNFDNIKNPFWPFSAEQSFQRKFVELKFISVESINYIIKSFFTSAMNENWEIRFDGCSHSLFLNEAFSEYPFIPRSGGKCVNLGLIQFSCFIDKKAFSSKRIAVVFIIILLQKQTGTPLTSINFPRKFKCFKSNVFMCCNYSRRQIKLCSTFSKVYTLSCRFSSIINHFSITKQRSHHIESIWDYQDTLTMLFCRSLLCFFMQHNSNNRQSVAEKL